MKHIGERIAARRTALGLSRSDLAQRAGISPQTILSVERDPTYNLSIRLLEQLAPALQVSFEITMKENAMKTEITMGNDEFILYIRKNHPECSLTNDVLGKRIWEWLRDQNVGAAKAGHGKAVACMWGETAANTGELRLPVNATQFTFDRQILKALYDLLDGLGAL